MVGIRVDRTEEFAEAFSAAVASATGGIIELDISVEAITPRTTLSPESKEIES